MTLVDTSAWVALADQGDRLHRPAAEAWGRLRRDREPLLLTDLILAEVAILLRHRAGHAAAVQAGEMILASGVTQVVYADEALFQAGWALFRRYRDRELSLTDCVSFALLRRRRLDRVFAFDEDFRIAGFELLG